MITSNNGGKNAYYDIDTKGKDTIDVDHIARELQMSFALGNVLKAVFGIAITLKSNKPRHKGTSIERDINKAIYYLESLKLTK